MSGRRNAAIDPCWEFAKQAGTFTYPDLIAATGKSYDTVVRKVRKWELVGAVIIDRMHGTRRVTARVINAAWGLSPAPIAVLRTKSAENDMWTAMRMMTTFDPVDIAAHASTDPDLARGYCRALSQIGYLRTTRTAVPGVRDAAYRLIRNTGPLGPRIRRVRGIWDENLGQFLLLSEAAK